MNDPERPPRELGEMLTLGLQLALSVVVFVVLGIWLDSVCSTRPVLTIVGACIGIIGSLIKFFKTATELGKQADKEMADHLKNRKSI
jgi:F0F1-type ATP synthase assembly protein I